MQIYSYSEGLTNIRDSESHSGKFQLINFRKITGIIANVFKQYESRNLIKKKTFVIQYWKLKNIFKRLPRAIPCELPTTSSIQKNIYLVEFKIILNRTVIIAMIINLLFCVLIKMTVS